MEEQLLAVKGVISFTIDVRQQRCTVRARTDIKPEVGLHIICLFLYCHPLSSPSLLVPSCGLVLFLLFVFLLLSSQASFCGSLFCVQKVHSLIFIDLDNIWVFLWALFSVVDVVPW